MTRRILITGGAGFIGSHVADELLRAGYAVRALDNLDPQVHGAGGERPSYLSADVELQVGDVRDRDVVRRALDGVDAVYHLASAVGVGQSMYQVAHYTAINNLGTAVLLEALIEKPVGRLVVASSMSIYGEGLYRAADGTLVEGVERDRDQFLRGEWEVCEPDGSPLTPVPTPEGKRPSLASVYALGKYDQERLCLMIGEAYGIPAVALRFFNVYGPRQALSNPYTGVLAIFASRLMNDRPPAIYEDGEQRRDFVSIHDVARACRLALESEEAAGRTFNVGSGQSYTISEIARRLSRVLGKPELTAEITGKYRVGDVRHCFADISLARDLIGLQPSVALDDGLRELAEWLAGETAVDKVAHADHELAARGLTLGAIRPEPAPSRQPTAARTVRAERPVLITGGAGFIGSNLAHRLLQSGHRVLVFDNLSRGGVERNLRWLRDAHGSALEAEIADIRDVNAVRSAVRRCRQLFHFAAQVAVTTSLDDPLDDFTVNARGALNVLEAVREQREPPAVLFTSTNKVYGGLGAVHFTTVGGRYSPSDEAMRVGGIDETQRLDFHSPYGCSKGTADQYVIDYARSFGIQASVFRMSCIYGPRQFGTEDQGWIAHFVLQALRGRPIVIYGDGMQVRDALYVDDLVDALLLAQERMPEISGRAFNIGGGPANAVSVREVIDLIGRMDGGRAEVLHRDWRVGDQRYYVSDTRRFSAAMGWAPRVGVEQGIERLYRWMKQSVVPVHAVREATAPIATVVDGQIDPLLLKRSARLAADGRVQA
jgi:dTDP-L-rhamnose 4-epimerase